MVVHLLFAGTAVFLLRERPVWILVVELVLVISLLIGFRLLRAAYEPFEILRAGVDLLEAKDFASRFRESGNPQTDPLVRLYNRMAGELREERVRNEEQEHFLRKILETGATGVVTFDLERRIAQMNPGAAALLGVVAAEVEGCGIEDVPSAFARSLETVSIGETQVVPLQGRRRVRCHRGTFFDRGFAREYLLLEELTEELRRSEKAAYEKLIRVMSHEVNNTAGGVTSLLGSCLRYAEQIAAEDREDYRHALEVASTRTERLNEFVKSFADVIRLPRPDRRPVRVPEILASLQVLLQGECRERNIRWVTRGGVNVPALELDAAQIEQALLNVLRNAVDAIGRDGEIRILWSEHDARPLLVIEDTGGGIPAQIRPHLFTPFFTSRDHGRGIGLTLVQEILLGHGLDFSLQDNERGGAAFTIAF
jgi:PAS domain S-box-containing protein